MRRLTLLFLAVFTVSGPTTSSAGDLADFLREWNDRQREFERRQERQSESFRERYRVQEQAPPPQIPYRLPTERVVTPSQSGLEPGYYNVPLPTGEQIRLNVRPGGQQGTQTGTSPVRRQQVMAEATALQSHVETIVRSIAPVGDGGLESAGERTQRAVRRMIDNISEADWDDARRENDRFKESFTDLVTRLDQYRVTSGLRAHIESASNIATRIDFALRAPSGGAPPVIRAGYDRPQLLGLTGALAEQGRRLQSAYAVDNRDWRSKALSRNIRRVRQGTEDLQEAVLDGADFDTLVEEYRQFDEDWHTLLESVERLNVVSPRLLEAGRDIWEIDWALHELLLVSAAYFPDRESAKHTLERAASSARRLDQELQLLATSAIARDRNFWTVEQAASQFAAEITHLAGRDPVKGIEATLSGNLQAVEIAWSNFRQAADRINLQRSNADVRRLMDRIEMDMERLRATSRGDYSWRL